MGSSMIQIIQAHTALVSCSELHNTDYPIALQLVQQSRSFICRSEISGALGRSKVSVSDMGQLPYTQATIAEVQRMARVAPVSVPHRVTAPARVGKYKIPQNHLIFANVSFIMNDPKYFDNPTVFNPSRFIDSDGRFVKNERVIPFGVGKRTCMGELLARNEIFIFVVDMLQNIKFQLPEDHEPPSPQNYLLNLTRIPD